MSIASKMSLRQRTRESATKIETIEQDLIKVVNSVNEVFGKFQETLAQQRELVMSLAQAARITPEQLQAVADTRRKERETKAAEEAKTNVASLVEKGVLVPAEKIAENSYIIGREFDKSGEVIHPGRVQVAFKDLKEAFQPKLLAQAVGFTTETEIGGKFEVQEIYSINEEALQKQAEAAQPPAPETAEASVTAETETAAQ